MQTQVDDGLFPESLVSCTSFFLSRRYRSSLELDPPIDACLPDCGVS